MCRDSLVSTANNPPNSRNHTAESIALPFDTVAVSPRNPPSSHATGSVKERGVRALHRVAQPAVQAPAQGPNPPGSSGNAKGRHTLAPCRCHHRQLSDPLGGRPRRASSLPLVDRPSLDSGKG